MEKLYQNINCLSQFRTEMLASCVSIRRWEYWKTEFARRLVVASQENSLEELTEHILCKK